MAVAVAAVVTFLLVDAGRDDGPTVDPTGGPVASSPTVPGSRVDALRGSLAADGLRCADLGTSLRCYDRVRRPNEPNVLVRVDLDDDDGGVAEVFVVVFPGSAEARLRELVATTGRDLFGLAPEDALAAGSRTADGEAGPVVDVRPVADGTWLATVEGAVAAPTTTSPLPSPATVGRAAAAAGLRCDPAAGELDCEGATGATERSLRVRRDRIGGGVSAVEAEVEGEGSPAGVAARVLDLLRPTGAVGPALERLTRAAVVGAVVEGDVDGRHAVVRATRYGPAGGAGSRVGVEVSLSPLT